MDEPIREMAIELKKKVSWTVFVWAIGVILIVIGLAFSFSVDAKNDAATLRNDVSRIDSRTDAQFAEVLRSLDRIEKEINTSR
jgi:hypothetical protein